MKDILGDEIIPCLHKKPLPRYPYWIPAVVRGQLSAIRAERMIADMEMTLNRMKARRYGK